MTDKITTEMLGFIKNSPSCFHTVKNIKEKLLNEGFIALSEKEEWNLEYGKKYFVTRNDSSIVSFSIPAKSYDKFLITASHSDSPSFKIKENPEFCTQGYVQFNVEKYGGTILSTWFDRPLSLAGRVILNREESNILGIDQKLINIDKDLLVIPNLAIHMNRDINEGYKYDVQSEMIPVVSLESGFDFKKFLASEIGVQADSILSYDLFIYNRDEPKVIGKNGEFILSPKLDDIECVYTTLLGFLEGVKKQESNGDSSRILVHAVFDNEEVGSQSRQGAGSTFLRDVLYRINTNLNYDKKNVEELFNCAIAKSFLISADNAHGIHPNYVGRADPVNRPVLNGGPVIKFNASQKYTSDSLSASVFKKICKNADVPFQIFTNNSNIAGGSTLGNISQGQVSVLSVDIGLAQWAMHSANETAGAKDPVYMVKAITEYYETDLDI